MASKLRLEVLVASPPTKKCQLIMKIFSQLTTKYPNLWVDIYYAGSSCSSIPTQGYQNYADKNMKVPSAFANGVPIPSDKWTLIEVESLVKAELNKGEEKWQE